MVLHPLTQPQQSVWNMEQFFGGSVANLTGSAFFTEPVDTKALEAALNKTIEQFDSLRIRIRIHNGKPMQYINKFEPHPIETIRFAARCDFHQWVNSLARTPFDITGSLYRVYMVSIEKDIGFVVHLHHITADAWTLNMFGNTVMKALHNEALQNNPYFQCLHTEREYDGSVRREKDKAYFLSKFEEVSEPVHLSEKKAKDIEANRISFTIGGAYAARIQAFCSDMGLSPYSLFINVLAVYMYRIKGMQDMFLGTTVLNRSGKKEKSTAGMFINTIPMLLHVDETKSGYENLRGNSAEISASFRHHKYQYSNLLKDIREKYRYNGRLYDVMLNYQNAAIVDCRINVQWHFCGCQGESLNIHINDRQNEGVFHLDYDYQVELFTQRDIERMHEQYMNLIFDMLDNPHKRPQELKLLSDAELNKVVVDFNDTAVDTPRDKCIHQLIEEQVERTPDTVAVVFEDIEYTYREINDMANSLAHLLRDKGVSRGDIVAVIAKRSYKIIVALFAILKAGGVYLPIDPNYPQERIAYMMKDAGCKIALTVGTDVDHTPAISLDMVNLAENTSAINNINTPDDLCYCIYTSGSTGLPKGTLLHHRVIANLIEWESSSSKMILPQNIALTTTISFDVSIQEIFTALLLGKTAFLTDDSMKKNIKALVDFIEKKDIGLMFTTPSYFDVLTRDIKNAQRIISKVKEVVLAGEAFYLNKNVMNIEKNVVVFHNQYGPAETHVITAATIFGINKKFDITIGKPIANTQLYILDKHLNPLPIGVVGELCVVGASVGSGYLNRPELTAEKFIDSPFGRGKMYKTGDLAKWREDGEIIYIGRMDNQVKVRGLRIELGEIENAISQCEGVKQAAVTARINDDGKQYIYAYYIGETASIKDIKTTLARKLPQYMIPHFFMLLGAFPATPSGKIDRKALPTPDFAYIQSDTEYAPPVTDKENLVIALMQKVLRIQSIGLHDSFFDLGGDSLNAIEFVCEAQDNGMNIEVQDVFNCPTAALMIKHMADGICQTAQYKSKDFDKIHKQLEKNIINENEIARKQPLGDVLITGATGWLGVHVLDEFLSFEPGIAYCLVRGRDYADSKRKLDETVMYYFGDKYTQTGRIAVICGDITEKIVLNHTVGTIIHCAANVKHYGSCQHSYNTNVTGTKNMIALAKEAGAKLLHISTTAVSGNSFNQYAYTQPTIFDETKFFIEQPLENVYVRSKFEAEVLVLQARLEGLEAAVVRVGNLANRRLDLRFQKNHGENATLTKIQALTALGSYPVEMADYPLEFSPVDNTAQAIIKLAQHFNKEHSVFHAYNNMILRFEEFANVLQDIGLRMQAIPMEEFIRAIYDAGKKPESAYIHKAFVSEISSDGRLRLQSNISLSNAFTVWWLNKIGFVWADIDASYLEEYIQYFRSIGYIKGC